MGWIHDLNFISETYFYYKLLKMIKFEYVQIYSCSHA